MLHLLLSAVVALSSFAGSGVGSSPTPDPPTAHKLHVSYGNAAVEGRMVVARIRFFKDDLESALVRHGAGRGFAMAVDPTVDSLFMAYFSARFTVEVEGIMLRGRIVGSGADALDREPVWWYAVQFQAPSPVKAFRLRNTLLLDLFDDQRNVVKVVHFPDEKQKTYSFGAGEEVFEVRFR